MKYLCDPRYLIKTMLKLAVLVTVIGGFVATGLFPQTLMQAHAAGNNASFKVQKGSLTLRGTVDLSRIAVTHAASKALPMPSRVQVNRPAPDITLGGGAAPAIKGLTRPATTGSRLAQTGTIMTNFNGISNVDSANANGFDVEPPDQGLCVNNHNVLEVVNLAATVYARNGTIKMGPISLNSFFNEPAAEFLSDPRCFFDTSTQAWFATVLAIDPSNTASHQDVAVSLTNTPSVFTVYQFDTTDLNNPGCPCFGDQPLLGIDQHNIYVSTNEFSILGPNFNGSQIFAFSKSQLVALATSVNFVHFGNLGIDGVVAGSMQPAITNGSAKAEYFVQTITRHAVLDNRLGVWALTDGGRVSSGGIPNLTNVVITSEAYGAPPLAQSPGGVLLNTDDTRMQQVQFINGTLWGASDTIVNVAGDSAPRAGAAWFKISPSLDSQNEVISNAKLVDQGYVTSQGNFLLYPAIEQSPDGKVAMVMTLSGPNTFPSAVEVNRSGAKRAQFGAINMIEPGVTADHGFTCTPGPCRWGDYSAAAFDPSNGGASIWMATEYIPGTGDAFANWGTRVAEVRS